MNKKIISITALTVLLAFGFIYGSVYVSDNCTDGCIFCKNNSGKASTEAKFDRLTTSVKDKGFDCTGNCTGKCPELNKDGKSSGNSSEQMNQSGKQICPHGNCSKNKKVKDI